MSSLQYSTILQAIMKKAEKYREENNCSGANRDYLVAASLSVLELLAVNRSILTDTDEFRECQKLLSHLDGSEKALEKILGRWNGQKTPLAESVVLAA